MKVMVSNKWKKRIMKLKGFINEVTSILLLRYTKGNAQRLARRFQQLSVNRLHVGCGNILIKGWMNILYERREEYGRIQNKNGALRLNYNLLKTWPMNDESIEYIAGSHFIEHLDLNAGMKFAAECFRVLKKGGVLRLSCPDLEIYARNYAENNEEFFKNDLIREWCCFKKAVTPGEIFVAKAYDSGGAHKWFYDFASLKHVLEEAGFTDCRKKGRLEGQVPDLQQIEPPQRNLETLYVEAVKE